MRYPIHKPSLRSVCGHNWSIAWIYGEMPEIVINLNVKTIFQTNQTVFNLY